MEKGAKHLTREEMDEFRQKIEVRMHRVYNNASKEEKKRIEQETGLPYE